MKTDTPSQLQKIVEIFKDICGDKYVYTDKEVLQAYGSDQTLDFHFPFDILVKPASPEDISSILKVCNDYFLPITPRGGGSGVTGGALPVKGGVVLSLERLNKIIEIDNVGGYVIAESGVITADLCEYVEYHDLYFPVFPSSGAYSFIGGNVAENAGSINSCKYGTTSNYVLNLEVVLPSGEIIWTGANVLKNATGLNLTPLFIGSEGILGVITKVVFKLLPKPRHEITILVGFKTLEEACDAIIDIKKSTVFPSGVELICLNAIKLTSDYLEEDSPLVLRNLEAHLLISLHEVSMIETSYALEIMTSIIEKYTQEDILVAQTDAEKMKINKLRLNIGNALVSNGKNYRDVDVCVPLSILLQYIRKVESICKEHSVNLVCFGHALDGNLHTNLVFNHGGYSSDEITIKKILKEIYQYAISKGGVISGEHGIGMLQIDFMTLQFSPAHLALLQSIKRLFDPNRIMNPGKILN